MSTNRAFPADLQDQDAPTAAQHSKQANGNGIAPHQASQYQHVQEERHSEEQTLADAWNMAGQSTGQSDAVDQSAEEGKPTDNAANGESADGGEDTDGDDDDMMDRISSSPSIDDGGYTRFPLSTTTPPQCTPRRTSVSREAFNQSPTPTMDSSPFVDTPRYLPLRPLGLENVPRFRPTASDDLSPSLHTPQSSPLLSTATFGEFVSATSVRQGRYGTGAGVKDLNERSPSSVRHKKLVKRAGDPSKRPASHPEERKPGSRPLSAHIRRNAFSEMDFAKQLQPHVQPKMEKSPSNSSIGSFDLQQILLPAQDPLLGSPRNSDSSWDTVSDELNGQDKRDYDADAFLKHNDRFIDSGWGGECLRDTEDIDFEFVYALHTFVATVEGQANATKGDTMVLLDDSNSYWWLVRVVKDSSIGAYMPLLRLSNSCMLTCVIQATSRLSTLRHQRNVWQG